jgi:hypothetical protein
MQTLSEPPTFDDEIPIENMHQDYLTPTDSHANPASSSATKSLNAFNPHMQGTYELPHAHKHATSLLPQATIKKTKPARSIC